MKKIINGKKYDTDTAKILGSTGYSHPGDFSYWYEALYQKKTGEFFLHGVGGAMSKYARSTGLNEWTGGEEIIPLSPEEARKWAEKNIEAEEYERIFGTCEE
ncbi:MAG: hypothetical protein GX860_11145 [Alcaligenaceae bacterium]|jgi:hypothetical protein|nr:hypothetical protein [Alcaligenaceae bacterium]